MASSEPEVSGWLTKQGGRHKNWKRRWFVIRGKQMMYFKDQADTKPLGVITLASAADKAGALTRDVRVISSQDEPKKDNCFEITGSLSASRSFFCFANTASEMDKWVDAIRRVIYRPRGGGMFGAYVTHTCRVESPGNPNHVPHIVTKCVEWLKVRLDEVGLFRLPGRSIRIRELKTDFSMGLNPDISSEEEIHAVASLLKLYLRELPEPLLTFSKFDAFISAGTLHYQNPDEGNILIRQLIGVLPRHNAVLLKYLCEFLAEVVTHSEVNKMNLSNIATVFGPNFLMPESSDPKVLMDSTTIVHYLTTLIISDHASLFTNMPPEEEQYGLLQDETGDFIEYESEEEDSSVVARSNAGTESRERTGSFGEPTRAATMVARKPPTALFATSTPAGVPSELQGPVRRLQEELIAAKDAIAQSNQQIDALRGSLQNFKSLYEREQHARIDAEQRLQLLMTQLKTMGVVLPNAPDAAGEEEFDLLDIAKASSLKPVLSTSPCSSPLPPTNPFSSLSNARSKNF